ncbi:Pro-kumamolisin, activation domain-containing protein [Roridomyces roridus]|uniref:Pro-kumamolisin, activation domain-containing protein n=1 Tax=Roridomyces roridus TaxID=1738132 RepID=A0AAD7AYI6_9AGAR|nr:Pro-kumamolisin, activation domain-containing protein [Roridomyces roridus]
MVGLHNPYPDPVLAHTPGVNPPGNPHIRDERQRLHITGAALNELPQLLRLRRSRSAAPAGFIYEGTAPESDQLTLRLALAGKNISGLHDTLTAISTPGHVAFRRWLSADEVKEFVKPSSETLAAFENFTSANGLSATSTSPHGNWVSVNMPYFKIKATKEPWPNGGGSSSTLIGCEVVTVTLPVSLGQSLGLEELPYTCLRPLIKDYWQAMGTFAMLVVTTSLTKGFTTNPLEIGFLGPELLNRHQAIIQSNFQLHLQH